MATFAKATKFRLSRWLNTETMKAQFGIQGLVNGQWHHCSEEGKPLIYDTKPEAQAKLKEIKAGDGEGTLKLPRVI
ncbi:MAG: hypothetical protein M0T70_02775 [Geobacteraceae bacterium]|nr:hypothetical protein [Geobacteraceae bacterium]